MQKRHLQSNPFLFLKSSLALFVKVWRFCFEFLFYLGGAIADRSLDTIATVLQLPRRPYINPALRFPLSWLQRSWFALRVHQARRQRRWRLSKDPLKPFDPVFGQWGIRPGEWRRWFKRSSLFLFTCFFTLLFTGILGWFLHPAYAAVELRIEPLTWDFVGLDSNKPETQGPNTYVVGARVCNVGSTDATNVEVEFIKDGIDSAYTFINLQGTELLTIPILPAYDSSDTQSIDDAYVFDNPDIEPGSGALHKTKYQIDYTPSNCYDAYYNFDVTRSPTAWHTTQRYYIEARAAGAVSVQTPRPRQIYIEQLISQSRNYVISFTCDAGSGPTTAPVVEVGDVFTCTAIAHTATAYPQLSFTADFPNIIFQILNVSSSYTEPPNLKNSAVYADGCGWVQDPTDPRYHKTSSQCEGENDYTDQYTYGTNNGAVGETITTTYTIEVLSTGVANNATNTVDTTNIILDNSGGSYHYNADLGISPNLVNITINKASLSDISVQKSHTRNFTPGDNTYTITITDSDADVLGDGTTPTADPIATKAPVIVEDTLPTGYTFDAATPVTGANATNWDCTVFNSSRSIRCIYDFNQDGTYDNFPDNTTETLTFNIDVDGTTAAVNSVNTVTINGNNDYNLTNNIDTDPTILVNAANLVLSKDDQDADTTGFNPSETAPTASPGSDPTTDPAVVAGQQMTYNFTVTNSSGTVTAAQPIVLTDSLPDGLTYASDNSGSLADWFCVVEGQNITCTYDQDLGPGASAPVLTLVADTNASGVASGTSAEITNTATVTSPTTEANITNNTSSDNFLLTLPVSDLTIAKTDFDAAYVVTGQQNTGEQLVYTITIKNNGVVATTGPIEIRETLPAFNSGVTSYPVTYVSHSGLGPDGTTAITWVCTEGIDPTTTTACTTATTGETTFTYDGSLAPGETAQLRLVVLGPSVDPTTLDSTTTTNNVEIFLVPHRFVLSLKIVR